MDLGGPTYSPTFYARNHHINVRSIIMGLVDKGPNCWSLRYNSIFPPLLHLKKNQTFLGSCQRMIDNFDNIY